jgi:orotate phosphoribosyltransferase
MNIRTSLAQKIFSTSNIKGEFRLRSGAVSNEYFDKYLFESNPSLLAEIGQAMSTLLPKEVDALAGLEMGGIPIATILSQITSIPTLFIRKAAKDYGTCKLAEGGAVANRNLVIIEDVVTSGGAILEAAQALRSLGANISDVLCVIDRESGGTENLAAKNLRLHSLFTMTELKNAAGVQPIAAVNGRGDHH